jgi:electron transfer flavoprotein alpha subunit
MGALLVIGEASGAHATRLTLELATLAVGLAADLGATAHVVLAGRDVGEATTEVAAHGPDVLVASAGSEDRPGASAIVDAALAAIDRLDPDVVLVGATQDGHDVAGSLLGLTERPLLASATAVRVAAARLVVDISAFGVRFDVK